MVRPSLLSWSLAFLAALGARTASAAPITLTGVVERDFDQANPSVRISPISTDPAHIGAGILDDRARLGLGLQHQGRPIQL